MAGWTPNPTAAYAVGPFATSPVQISTGAFGGGVTNATKIYAADGAHRPAFSLIALLPVGALSAGKFLLLASAAPGGQLLTEVDELPCASQSAYSQTASGSLLTFTRWTRDTPLILPETADLYVASTVSQPTPPTAFGMGKLY